MSATEDACIRLLSRMTADQAIDRCIKDAQWFRSQGKKDLAAAAERRLDWLQARVKR